MFSLNLRTIALALFSLFAAASTSQAVDIITPEQFGAVGDGVTDDTVALQAMFASNPASVYLTRTYLFSSQLSTGAGNIFGGGTLKVSASYTPPTGPQPVLLDTAVSFTWSDFSINGSAYTGNTATTAIIGYGATRSLGNAVISNVGVSNVTHDCVRFSGTANSIQILNPRIANCGLMGIDLSTNVSKPNVQIQGGFIEETGSNAVFFLDTLGGGVDRVHMDRSLAPPILYAGLGGVQTGGFVALHPTDSNLIISNNIMNDNRAAVSDCIILSEVAGVSFQATAITGNIINNCGGFAIDGASNFTITGNNINLNAVHGINLDQDLGGNISHVVVVGNKITNIKGVCIAVGTFLSTDVFQDITINDNSCNDDRGAGSLTTYCYEIDVHTTSYVDPLNMLNNSCRGFVFGAINYPGTSAQPIIKGIAQTANASITWAGGTPSGVVATVTSYLGSDTLNFTYNITMTAANGANGFSISLPSGRTASGWCTASGREVGVLGNTLMATVAVSTAIGQVFNYNNGAPVVANGHYVITGTCPVNL